MIIEERYSQISSFLWNVPSPLDKCEFRHIGGLSWDFNKSMLKVKKEISSCLWQKTLDLEEPRLPLNKLTTILQCDLLSAGPEYEKLNETDQNEGCTLTIFLRMMLSREPNENMKFCTDTWHVEEGSPTGPCLHLVSKHRHPSLHYLRLLVLMGHLAADSAVSNLMLCVIRRAYASCTEPLLDLCMTEWSLTQC